jgi:hypothetical protein
MGPRTKFCPHYGIDLRSYVECYYRYINIKTKENNSNTTIIIIAYGIIFGKMVSHL